MQTQQNMHSLPASPVEFCVKILKAVVSGITDSPRIHTTSETEAAARFCRSRAGIYTQEGMLPE